MGPQIRRLFRDDMFNIVLQGDEKQDWNAFRLVSTNFLGNIRAENYKELSVDKKNQLDVTFVFFISLLLVAQHVSGNHVPIIRS